MEETRSAGQFAWWWLQFVIFLPVSLPMGLFTAAGAILGLRVLRARWRRNYWRAWTAGLLLAVLAIAWSITRLQLRSGSNREQGAWSFIFGFAAFAFGIALLLYAVSFGLPKRRGL